METEVIREQPATDFEAYMENSKRMQEIVRLMKEIPELPSEIPKDVNPLEKVEFPEKGGILTYMGGHEQPYKGFPFFEMVEKVDTIKKIQRATLSSLYHSLKKRSWFTLAPLIFVPWLFGDIVKAYVQTFHRLIMRFKIKNERYCDAMRELNRAFSIEFYGEVNDSKELRFQLRDVACMFLEFDNAYRFRFQDVIVELDKQKLKKNPAKEIVRLLEVMSTREKTQEIKDTWKLVRYFLPLYLRFNKSLRKSIVAVLDGLDLDKVQLSIEDRHYCKERKDYQFKFMN